jgi:hypothetical protein
MSTLTEQQQNAIAEYLASHELSRGLGTGESACSIAAINLTLTGKLTDIIPECMSEVIGDWIIVIQDGMPHDLRNSAEWKSLLPLAAGTGRKHEQERIAILVDHLWAVVMPLMQSMADNYNHLVASHAHHPSNEYTLKEVAKIASTTLNVAWIAHDPSSRWEQINPCGLLARLIEVGQ